MKLLWVVLLAFAGYAWAADLTTIAERSQWKKTGRYDEVIRLCHDFEKAYPKKVKCQKFGETPEGRPMLALIASEDGKLTPLANHRADRPIVFAQGGIHAGEIDGKDAGFWLLRNWLTGKTSNDLLKAVTWVFVPVFNIDGHERFGKWNRPNQVGPEEMGWRTTGQNLNLNRDYVKADAPEMVAMLTFLNRWDPMVHVDLHVTDGAKFQPDVAVMVQPLQSGPETLRAFGKAFSQEIMERIRAKGGMPLPYYPSFIRDDEPSSGIGQLPALPRLSHGYWGNRNRFGVLVETHSWKDYATRVQRTYDALTSILTIAAKQGPEWLKAMKTLDRQAGELAGQKIDLAFENTKTSQTIDFPGYQYTRETSKVSGAPQTKYDDTKKETWQIPHFAEIQPKISVTLPKAGYYVPAAIATATRTKLDTHGIEYQVVPKALKAAEVESFRATEATVAEVAFEGRVGLTVKGQWAAEKHDIPAGSLFVPIAQPRAVLIAYLLEPNSPDSLLSWGQYHAFFEQKESMEAYVAEAVAEEMLKDPEVRKAFDHELENAEFAKSPAKRLDFFYRRHPSYDDRFNLYPVYRK
jgi:hypothetical protein